LQESEHYFKEIVIGKSKHKRYSPKALDSIKSALPEVDMEEVWRVHGPKRGSAK
jgi:hypothetical protein